MDAVRQSVMKAQDFAESADFDPWAEIAQSDRSAFVGRYSDLFPAHLAQKKKNAETRLRSVPERPRDMRSGGSVVSGAGSADASPVRSTVSVVSSTKKSRRELQTSLASSLGVKRGSTLPVVGGSKVADVAGEQSGSCSSKGRNSVRRTKRGIDKGGRKKKAVLESDCSVERQVVCN